MNHATGWDTHVHVFERDAPVVPGHYAPVPRTLAEIEAAAAAHGIGRLVLVQPSVYGTDHGVLLRALQAGGGRHRGVAVVGPGVTDNELDTLHAAGVRGVRFNLVSPAAPAFEPGATLEALATRLRARGWHVQWYAPPERLPQIAAWQAAHGLVFVLDHLAGLHAELPADDPAWAAAAQLAAGGAWVKLSGWYRLRAAEPYTALRPALRRVAALFGPRTLWGSDWPHTSFPPDRLPTYVSTLEPVRAALGEAALAAIVGEHPSSLYLP